jgi:hypothetical protein
MNNMARNRRQTRNRGCRRNKNANQMGGNTGQSYTFGASIDPKNLGLGNAAEVIPFSSCGNAVSPGFIQNAQIKGGLPGFAGGRRSKKMNGGRYSPGFEVVGPSAIALTAANYSGCGDGMLTAKNPYNEASASMITAPPPFVPLATPLKGGRRRRSRKCWSGGNSMGTMPVDAMLYEAPRSGYTTIPSNSSGGNAGTLADGKTPFLVNVPYTTQPNASSACIKTGGRRTRSSYKKRKNTRKSRKNSRK